MTKLIYDADIDASALDGQTVAVIGYGSQGEAHARNLAESGVTVVVGLRPDSGSAERAREAGLRVTDAATATAEANVVMVLVPDTAVWGFELFAELGPRLDAPLLTANQVTLWHAFDLAGLSTNMEQFGALRGLAAGGVTETNAEPEEEGK